MSFLALASMDLFFLSASTVRAFAMASSMPMEGFSSIIFSAIWTALSMLSFIFFSSFSISQSPYWFSKGSSPLKSHLPQ